MAGESPVLHQERESSPGRSLAPSGALAPYSVSVALSLADPGFRKRNNHKARYYQGRVLEGRVTETTSQRFDVEYDDGDVELAMALERVKPIAKLKSQAAMSLAVGDEALVAFRGNTRKLYLAQVTEVEGHGEGVRYSVRYSDGDEETGVGPKMVIATEPELGVGKKTMVMAQARGHDRWFPGVIVNVRQRMVAYDIAYDNDDPELEVLFPQPRTLLEGNGSRW